MALAIESPRFGHVEIDPESVIEFPEGLIGLGGTQFALLANDPDSPIVWLHCIDEPSLALPVTDPKRFFSTYNVELTDDDGERLGLDDSTAVDVFVTVVAASDVKDFTANQKAPILVWNGRGYQIINQDPSAELRAPLFAEVLDTADGAEG